MNTDLTHLDTQSKSPRRWRRRSLGVLAACMAGIGSLTFMAAAAPAGAAVASNGLQATYYNQVGTTCAVEVGDRSYSNSWADGAVSVFGCNARYHIQSDVELMYSSSPSGPFRAITSMNYNDTTGYYANDYTSLLCGGSGYFYTAALVSIGGAGYFWYTSYVNRTAFPVGSCSVSGYPTS